MSNVINFKDSLKSKMVCDFCGNEKSQARHLIGVGSGNGVRVPSICNECLDRCSELLEKEKA